MSGHAFGCAGDAGCSCGCANEADEGMAPFLTSVGAAPGVTDPFATLFDMGSEMLPLPGPLQHVVRDAAQQGVATFAQEAQRARSGADGPVAQAAAEAAEQVQAAAQQTARAVPKVMHIRAPKRGLSRRAKVGLAVGGAALVVAGVAAKVLL